MKSKKVKISKQSLYLYLLFPLATIVLSYSYYKVYHTTPNSFIQITTFTQHPHDPASFTQGLLYDNGYLIESTGGYGTSYVRRLHPTLGTIITHVDLPNDIFGEGLTQWQDTYILLTYHARHFYVLDRETLQILNKFPITTTTNQGWGITSNGLDWIITDGSHNLLFFHPHDSKAYKKIPVLYEKKPLRYLNELEYDGLGHVFANVWMSDNIYKIALKNGEVQQVFNASKLVHKAKKRKHVDAVLNGIAYNAKDNLWYLTGKWYDSLFTTTIE